MRDSTSSLVGFPKQQNSTHAYPMCVLTKALHHKSYAIFQFTISHKRTVSFCRCSKYPEQHQTWIESVMAYYDAADAAKIAEIAAVNGEIIAMRAALDAAESKALALRSRGLTSGYKMDLAEKATKLAKNAMDAFHLLEMKSRFAMRRKLFLEKKKQTCECCCCSAKPSIPELDGLTEEELMSVSVGVKRIRE
jgi:hypothetical protein